MAIVITMMMNYAIVDMSIVERTSMFYSFHQEDRKCIFWNSSSMSNNYLEGRNDYLSFQSQGILKDLDPHGCACGLNRDTFGTLRTFILKQLQYIPNLQSTNYWHLKNPTLSMNLYMRMLWSTMKICMRNKVLTL